MQKINKTIPKDANSFQKEGLDEHTRFGKEGAIAKIVQNEFPRSKGKNYCTKPDG